MKAGGTVSNYPERKPAEAYTVVLPSKPQPIVIIGAGGIVKDAHLPAYRKAGFTVWGIVNRTAARAQALATEYGIPNVYTSLPDAVAGAPADAVYDLALMPEQYPAVLDQLPDGAAVLIQKPFGQNLAEARVLLKICTRKKLVAAVNTQLRFAPYVAEARKLIAAGAIGELYDLEIRVATETPWEIFPHVLGMERLELNMHSVHYMDLVRSFLGDPDGVSAATVRNPAKPEVSNTRSTIIMRYRDRPFRVTISTNHDHGFGDRFEEAFIKWEGTTGAIRAQMGLMLDYPRGGPDALDIAYSDKPELGWQPIPFEGSWFPDAFIGSMSALQRFVERSISELPNSVGDVMNTMAVVEAGYESQEREGIPLATKENTQ